MSIFALRSNGLASSAYKNLSRAQTSLTDNISRLALDLRINKTADDSAGSKAYFRNQRFFDFEYHKHNSIDSISGHHGKRNGSYIPDISTSLSSGTCLFRTVFIPY